MIFFKKTVLFFIIFLIVFNTSGILKFGVLKFSPSKAEAQWAVFDAANIAQMIWDYVRNNYQKWLRDIIAKRLIDYIVDETVKWINGGGDPKFVSDWQGFINDAGKIAEDSFIKELGLAPLCSPFSAQVRISLLPVKKFSKRIECTLDKVVSNINNFYADFSQGGWIAYNEMWEPQNNFFGATLMASMEKSDRIKAEVNAKAAEAASGGGFLSFRTCEGSTYQDKEGCENNEGACVSVSSNGKQVWCSSKKSKINTPGSTVGAAVAKGVTSDIEWASNIESWVSAIVNAAINRVIKEGVSALNNSNNPEYSGSSYYPDEYKPTRDAELNQNKDIMILEVKKFIDGWNSLLTIKEDSLNYVLEIFNIEQTLRDLRCSDDAAVNAAQAEFDRLNLEVDELRAKISEGESLIDEITNADATNAEEWQGTLSNYRDFMRKYESDRNSFSTTSLQTARDERSQKKGGLTGAQTRLNSCVPLNATSTTPQ